MGHFFLLQIKSNKMSEKLQAQLLLSKQASNCYPPSFTSVLTVLPCEMGLSVSVTNLPVLTWALGGGGGGWVITGADG